MVAIGRDDRHDLVERASESSPIAGVVHGLILAVPLWTLVASVIVAVSTH
ncbi:hypothetical protein [Labedella endophytica]|nr:hypothetical protein [Labedella endophytica]